MRSIILRFLVLATALAGALPAQSTILPTDVAHRVDSVMRDAERAGFAGAVLVAKDGNVLHQQGYGLADRARNIPFNASTVLQIGSNTKDFTTVAVLQLVQRGALSLDDSIGKFFGAVPPDKRGITVRHLLTHRSGMRGALGGDFEPLLRDAFIARALSTPLTAPPGSQHIYSNPGFSVLAAIVEILSSKSYDEYVRDNILVPSGLKRTGFHLPGFPAAEMARGYRGDTDNGTLLEKARAPDGPYWNLRGNGGMLSTVGEMHRFYQLLFTSDKLIPVALRDMFLPANEPMILAGSDGVCFFLYDREPQQGYDIFVASTVAEQRAPQAHARIAQVLGLGGSFAPTQEIVTAPVTSIRIPESAEGKTVSEYFRSYNSGDSTTMRKFFEANMLPNPQAPAMSERLSRYNNMFTQFGKLTPTGFRSLQAGLVEVDANTAVGERVTLRFELESAAPHRIRSLQIRVGG